MSEELDNFLDDRPQNEHEKAYEVFKFEEPACCDKCFHKKLEMVRVTDRGLSYECQSCHYKMFILFDHLKKGDS